MNRIEDTLSPMLGISRGLAIQAFATQSSCHSLFYLELSLVCKASGYLEIDLPVSLQINLEKSWVRVFLEGLQLVRELPKILLQSRAGTYSPIPRLASVTADDWGLSPGVNQGILHLAQQGIIRRISVMANTRYIEDGLHELLAIPGIEVGLHFNLTYGKPLQNNPPLHSELLTAAGELIPSPARFLARWMNPWSRSRADHIRFAQAEFESQLKRLRDLAIPVDYLDGHHHIHLVPGLLKAMSGIMIQNRIKKVRLPYDPQLWKTPQAPLLLLSLWAQPVFKAFNLKALPCLYPSSALFYNHPKLRGILRSQLIRKPDTEIIVHPAAVNDLQDLEFLDSYQDGRVIEFQSLQMLLCSRAPLLLKKEPSLD
jgi:predicted glycoside hydrolase/deacetylase ChbG (UPF0249 family)